MEFLGIPAEEGSVPVDISDIAAENYDYAVHLATKQGVLSFHDGLFRFEKPLHEAFASIDLWRELCIAAEILLKAVLLHHEVPIFRKRSHAEYGPKVTAGRNSWLQRYLEDLQIEFVAQINTGTVSLALRSAEEHLYGKLSLDPAKQRLISETFYIIIRTRRNRNTHFYFPNQAVFDASEIEILFLPLLNTLTLLYLSA